MTDEEGDIVDRIVEGCFQESEAHWRSAFDRACEANPEHAEELRSRWRQLGDLLGGPPSDAAQPSDRFGRYRLVRQLGRGGMGVVHLACDESLGRDVALKLIRPEFLDSDRARGRFRREVEAASRLDDPGICTVYEAGEHEGVPYLSMRYVEGRSLEAVIKSRRDDSVASAGSTLTRERVIADVSLVARVARSLEVAHDAGLVHRDIKPGNVMLTEEGAPVVLDFGLVQTDEEGETAGITRSGELLGTPAYMAPEQIEPRGRVVDRRTDVYALGATLYELTTLRLPFEGHSIEGLARKIMSGRAPKPSSINPRIPRDLDVVIRTAMDPDPARRYRTAADLAEDLDRIRQFVPIRARPAGPLLRMRRWAQRSPWAAAALGVLFVASVVSTWLWIGQRRALRENLRLSDEYHLATQRESASLECWPIHPDQVQALESWLGSAESFRDMLRYHEARLVDEAQRASLSNTERWVNDHRVHLVDALREFLDDAEAVNGVHDVERRLEAARSLAARSSEAHPERWASLFEALDGDDRYAVLSRRPSDWVGLIPLGPDPDSGFQEFAHVLSGVPPERMNGQLQMSEASAIVLVLLPGGSVRVGCELDGVDDASADEDEASIDAVLDPFLIGKFETTQAQWRRISRTAPSQQDLGPNYPVQAVSWTDADTWLRRVGLSLPSEIAWEHAARGGTDWRWWTGADAASLGGGRVNLADTTFGAGRPGNDFDDKIEDPWSGAASAFDAGGPNPFGLHHALGNVYEWCADTYVGQRSADQIEPSTGRIAIEAESDQPTWRPFRGGSYYKTPKDQRVSRRWYHEPGYYNFLIGVRAHRTAPQSDRPR